MTKKLFTLSLFFFAQLSLTQETIILKEGNELVTLADKMTILIDSSGTMTMEDILKSENQQKFVPNPFRSALIIQPEQATWLKFTIENQTKEAIWADLFLSIVWEFDLYILDTEGGYQQLIQSGILRPIGSKPIYSSHYVTPLISENQKKPQTFYVKLYIKHIPHYVPHIGTEKKIISRVRFHDLRYGIYLGLMLVMILYNSYIGYITKDRVYLYYVLYSLYITYLVPTWIGDATLDSEILYKQFPVYGFLGYLLSTLFVFQCLDVKQEAKGFYKLIIALTSIQIFFSFLNLIGLFESDDYWTYSYSFSIPYNFTLWGLGVYLWSKGNKNTRFYTIAWTLLLMVTIWSHLALLHLVPLGEYLSNLLYMGFGSETILFSLALGDRLNNLQKEKEKAQGMEQKMLRAQMNPHFIFNSLTAIQNYMYQNNTIEAGRFLAKFSQLMRAILEGSRQEFILLEKEVTLLKNYLTLQQLRFENKFDFQVAVTKELDTEEIAIPPMFAQPFIENAIEHGLTDLAEKGEIKIKFDLQEDYVLLSIQDNGIGIEKSTQVKKLNPKKPESLATKITQERIEIFRHSFKKNITFEIQSLTQGTEVIFRLPYQFV